MIEKQFQLEKNVISAWNYKFQQIIKNELKFLLFPIEITIAIVKSNRKRNRIHFWEDIGSFCSKTLRELWFSKLLYFIKESEQGLRETFKFNSSLFYIFF